MARIVTFAEYGAPDVLKIEDVALPEPGPDEISIAVKAIGLNRAESMWRTGVYVEPVNLPAGWAMSPQALSRPSEKTSRTSRWAMRFPPCRPSR